MKLVYDVTNTRITLIGDEIATMINNQSSYSSVIVEVSKNCGVTTATTYSLANLADSTSNVVIVGDDLSLKPILFNADRLYSDGIYKVALTINSLTGGITYTNCLFIDDTIKCKLGAIIKDIVQENSSAFMAEKRSTLLHVLHYSLVNGSNCGCNCNDMCLIYDEMIDILSTLDPTITNCGCQ